MKGDVSNQLFLCFVIKPPHLPFRQRDQFSPEQRGKGQGLIWNSWWKIKICKASKLQVENIAATEYKTMSYDTQAIQSSSGLKNNFPGLLGM